MPSTPSATHFALSSLFFPRGLSTSSQAIGSSTAAQVPAPTKLWTLREECGGRVPGQEDSVWVVFRSHEEVNIYSFYPFSLPLLQP